jgi:hypothetical protein
MSPIHRTARLYPDMTTPDPEHVLPDTLHLVVIPRRPIDRWALRGDYVEVVWAEILGPTATAVARRLGRAAADLEVDLPAEAVTSSLAVSPRKALAAKLRHGISQAAAPASIWATSRATTPAIGSAALMPSTSR